MVNLYFIKLELPNKETTIHKQLNALLTFYSATVLCKVATDAYTPLQVLYSL